MASSKIPFAFVIDWLSGINPSTQKMFGATAVFGQGKMLLVLRQAEKDPGMNGVWVAVDKGFHEMLKKEIPSLQHFFIFGKPTQNWLLLPAGSENFETELGMVCDLILRHDPRIGRVPSKEKPK